MEKRAVPSARLWAGAVAALALALRLRGAAGHALDMDELLQFYFAARPQGLTELFPLLRVMPLHAVLDPLLTHLLARVSHELWWLRLQPALLGAACVPALLALGGRWSAATALGAAALLAVSAHHVEFSGFVDFYPFLCLWALLCTRLLLDAARSGQRRSFALYSASMAAFLYTHPWAALLMGLHGAWVAARHRRLLAPFAAACAAACAAFIPWLLYAGLPLLGEPRVHYDFPQPAPPAALWDLLLCWAGLPERGSLDPAPLRPWALAAAALLAAAAVRGALRARRERGAADDWSLAAVLAFGGPLAVVAADRLGGYDFAPRQALFALPFFLLFAAEGLRGLPAPATAALGGALAALALGLGEAQSRQLDALDGRLRGTLARLRAAPAGSTWLFDEPHHAARMLYYARRDAVLELPPPRRFENVYLFELPPSLSVEGHPVEAVWRPHETAQDEARRWERLAADVAAGRVSSAGTDFGFMRANAILKTEQFRARHEAAFRRAPERRGREAAR